MAGARPAVRSYWSHDTWSADFRGTRKQLFMPTSQPQQTSHRAKDVWRHNNGDVFATLYEIRYQANIVRAVFAVVWYEFTIISINVKKTTTSAGCRSENWCFCMSRLVCLRVGDIVKTSVVWRFMGRFWWGFSVFHNRLLFQMHYIVLIFVARWCHNNFREIAVKNCEKSKNRRVSLYAPLRIDSWDI